MTTNIFTLNKKEKEIKKEVSTIDNKIVFDQLDIKTDDLLIPYPQYLLIEEYLNMAPGLKYIHKHITFMPLRGIRI